MWPNQWEYLQYPPFNPYYPYYSYAPPYTQNKDTRVVMTAELKAAWLEALRSGEWEECRNALRRTEDSRCPLGVLCDLVDYSAWRKTPLWQWGDSNSIVIVCGSENPYFLTRNLAAFWDTHPEETFQTFADYIETRIVI